MISDLAELWELLFIDGTIHGLAQRANSKGISRFVTRIDAFLRRPGLGNANMRSKNEAAASPMEKGDGLMVGPRYGEEYLRPPGT